jgi:hypothetical protein
MTRIGLVFLILIATSSIGFTQNNNQLGLSQIFEKSNPNEEITRLEDKKFKLNLRLTELKEKDAFGNAEEILRIEGLVAYVDAKIAKQQKIVDSNQYAQKEGVPQKGALSEADYRAKKLDFYSKNTEKEPMVIQTTLTHYEFEKLPKERQERILNMPERYTIID